QPRHILRAAQLADKPRRMPGGAAGKLLALKQHDIRPAEFRQMVGDRAAGNAAADDDRAGSCGKFSHWAGAPGKGRSGSLAAIGGCEAAKARRGVEQHVVGLAEADADMSRRGIAEA